MIVGIPPYLLLLIAVMLIYLLDCVVVLYANEAIVKRVPSGWQVAFGSRQNWVAGKRLYLLNPFTPLVAPCRAHWSVSDGLAGVDEGALARCERHLALLARLDASVRAAAWVVLVFLPVAMMLWGPLGFLIGAVAAWAVVLVLLVRFSACRNALGLGRGEFLLIAFECLACPPNAVNLLRKLSLRFRMGVDLASLRDAMPKDRAALLLERIGEQTDAQLTMMDDDTPEYRRTAAWREALRREQSRLAAREEEFL